MFSVLGMFTVLRLVMHPFGTRKHWEQAIINKLASSMSFSMCCHFKCYTSRIVCSSICQSVSLLIRCRTRFCSFTMSFPSRYS